MRRIRNPRYAPEFLERKLSPSGTAGVLSVERQYSTLAPAATQGVDGTVRSGNESGHHIQLHLLCGSNDDDDDGLDYSMRASITRPDDSGCDPFDDPFVDDPPADDPTDTDLLPDVDPRIRNPRDLEDGQPPSVPLPPLADRAGRGRLT